ncbi:DUF402 domain-containing protein [Archangium minus]|uniref:DUF402 domain-containing protein n=2 Tax=Archangium minus TaxID=83450 RepID=A0ABY9WH64_9BACT|nr:DUF402 domain-containing protein [Archangium minus]
MGPGRTPACTPTPGGKRRHRVLNRLMHLYRKGQPITVHHGKPWKPGRLIQMRGHVASFDGELVRMTRRFQSPGRPYDGLFATQRRGDHGTIELPRGGWVARRRYLRQSGSLIGELYNIQTPVQLLPGEVRYVDLEIDVAYLPHRPERVQVQDVAEMEEAVARGHIPGEVAEVAREVAEELARRLGAWDGESVLEWDVRPEPARLTPAVEDFLQRHAVESRSSLT